VFLWIRMVKLACDQQVLVKVMTGHGPRFIIALKRDWVEWTKRKECVQSSLLLQAEKIPNKGRPTLDDTPQSLRLEGGPQIQVSYTRHSCNHLGTVGDNRSTK